MTPAHLKEGEEEAVAVASTTDVDADGKAVKKLKESPRKEVGPIRLQPLDMQCKRGKMITDYVITCPCCRRLNLQAKNPSKHTVREHIASERAHCSTHRLDKKPEERRKLDDIAASAGIAADKMLSMVVDSKPRAGGYIAAHRKNTMAAMMKPEKTGEIPHQIYRKYGVKMQARWIRDPKKKNQYAWARKLCNKQPGAELRVGDRHKIDEGSRRNVEENFIAD